MNILENINAQATDQPIEGVSTEQPTMQPSAPTQSFREKFAFLFAQSPAQPVEDFLNEPLNFDKSMSTARILRGLTGMFNSLNYAIIDVVIGLMEKAKERKPQPQPQPQPQPIFRGAPINVD